MDTRKYNYCPNCGTQDITNDGVCFHCGDMAYLNPWISVDEGLPEEGQQVLLFVIYQRMIGGVYCEDEIIVSGGRKEGDWFVGNDMMLWDYSFNLDFTDDDVTHWMEEPNPPKE